MQSFQALKNLVKSPKEGLFFLGLGRIKNEKVWKWWKSGKVFQPQPWMTGGVLIRPDQGRCAAINDGENA